MYDGLDRLTSASYEETRPDSSIINYGYGIGYFLSGNRSIFYDNGAFFLYNYNARNQLTTRYYDSSNFTTNSYSYDANGNLTQAVNYLDNATTDFAYDAENRLTTVTDNLAALQTTYTYNPLGERIAQTTQGWVNGAVDGDPTTTNYLLDLSGSLSQVLSETTAGIETAYLNGIGQQKDGQWSYFTQDGLGSIRQLLTSTGDVTYSATYDPYGRVLNDHTTGTNDSKLGFTGEQTDDNGLIYLRARYYSPEMNTFLSRDPVEGVADRFMSRNGYSYVEANPVNYTDPSGRFPWMLFGGLAALAVLLSGDSVQSNRSNTTDAMVGEMALGVLCDACDAALTIRDIHQDGFHPLHLLGLLPIIPASWVNKVIKGLGWTARKAGSVIQRGVYAFAHSGSAFDNLLKLGTSNSNWFRSTTKTIERGLGDVHNLDDLERIEREIVDLPSNERAYGFANDGNAVISLEGSIDQVSWRGEQVEKIYGGTVTHNHPRSGVAPLSPDDIHLAWGANLQEMRAVHRSRSGQIYVFSAKPGANGWDFTMPQLYNALQQARGKILDSLDNHFLQYASTRRNSQLYDYLVYNIDHASLSMAAKELGFQYTVKVLK
jgi:RHS repeat-associated protein